MKGVLRMTPINIICESQPANKPLPSKLLHCSLKYIFPAPFCPCFCFQPFMKLLQSPSKLVHLVYFLLCNGGKITSCLYQNLFSPFHRICFSRFLFTFVCIFPVLSNWCNNITSLFYSLSLPQRLYSLTNLYRNVWQGVILNCFSQIMYKNLFSREKKTELEINAVCIVRFILKEQTSNTENDRGRLLNDFIGLLSPSLVLCCKLPTFV